MSRVAGASAVLDVSQQAVYTREHRVFRDQVTINITYNNSF
jgi:hypothetical protein